MLGPPWSCYSRRCLGNPRKYCFFHLKLLVKIISEVSSASLAARHRGKTNGDITLPLCRNTLKHASVIEVPRKDTQIHSVRFELFQEGILRLETPNPAQVQAGVPGAQEVIFLTQKITCLSPQSYPIASFHPASPGLVCVLQRGVTSASTRGLRVLVDGQVPYHLLLKPLNNFFRAVLVSQQNWREVQRFPMYLLLLPHCPRPPPDGTFATIDAPAWTRPCHPEPSVYRRVRAWWWTSCGCGQVYSATRPPSQRDTG